MKQWQLMLLALDEPGACPDDLIPIVDLLHDEEESQDAFDFADGLMLVHWSKAWPRGPDPIQAINPRKSLYDGNRATVGWNMYDRTHPARPKGPRRPDELTKAVFDSMIHHAPRCKGYGAMFIDYLRRSDAITDLAWILFSRHATAIRAARKGNAIYKPLVPYAASSRKRAR